MKVAVSILNSTNIKRDLELLNNTSCDYLHIDVMDNKFVTNQNDPYDNDIEKIIKYIKEYGIKVGLAIKPSTDVRFIEPFLDDINLVLLMSVEPGYGGQKFIPTTNLKIKELKELIKDKNILISVDGGIDNITKSMVEEADILVSGSYILKGNYEERIETLK